MQMNKRKTNENRSEEKWVGMSLSSVRDRLGIQVTARQFRRYIEAGLIPKHWVTKTAQGHFLMQPPPTAAAWEKLEKKIQKWRESRFKRGWSGRSRKPSRRLNPSDKSTRIVTIEGISQEFVLWRRKMEPEILTWDRERLERLRELLSEMGELWWWVEEQLTLPQSK